MDSQPGLRHPHLDWRTVQQLTRFAFQPRRFLDGRYTGRHASTQRGQSVEFRDFRQYMPGDDLGHVDWKVYGRSDKLYVRLFEHETELCITLLIDASASMDYDRRPNLRKYDHACRLAAAIAFVVMRAQDRVGFALAREGIRYYQQPSSAIPQLVQMLDTMQNRQPAETASLACAVDEIAEKLRRGHILILFSDLWEDLDELFQSIAQVNHAGAEVILFHVLHSDELKLPDWSDVIMLDSESRERLNVNVGDVRSDYQRRLRQHLDAIRARCRQFAVEYQFAPMTESFQRTLERFLVRRCAS